METGLSDFHKMIAAVMKTSYQKIEPRVINYRDYKGFSNEWFRVTKTLAILQMLAILC